MTDKTENGSAPEPSPELLEQREREEIEQQSLGIAGRLACTFIDSPVSPLLMMAALAIGLLGLMFTPRQEDPQISVPMIDIIRPVSGRLGGPGHQPGDRTAGKDHARDSRCAARVFGYRARPGDGDSALHGRRSSWAPRSSRCTTSCSPIWTRFRPACPCRWSSPRVSMMSRW